ncbi:hypothetical protein SAMN04488499_10871, partial [Sporomusa acidovorans]
YTTKLVRRQMNLFSMNSLPILAKEKEKLLRVPNILGLEE